MRRLFLVTLSIIIPVVAMCASGTVTLPPYVTNSRFGVHSSANQAALGGKLAVDRFTRYSSAHLVGPVGPQGEQGPQGERGFRGYSGSTGAQGPQGLTGSQGERGFRGYSGATGEAGPIGPQGPQGLQGLQGLQGETGATGPAGTFSRPESFSNISTVALAALPKAGGTMTGPIVGGATTGAAEVRQAIKPETNSTSALQLQKADGTNILNVDSTNGRVGIGTTSPTAKLDIYSGNVGLLVGADSGSDTRTNNTTKYGRIAVPHYTSSEEPLAVFLTEANATANIASIGGGSGAMNAATDIRFLTAANNTTTTGTERLRIDKDGRVGIGTAAPTGLLHSYATATGAPSLVVGGTASVRRLEAAGIDGFVRFYLDSMGNPFWTGTATGLNLALSGTLTSSSTTANNYFMGNVGIGTTTPATKLHATNSTTNTSSVAEILRLEHLTSNTAAPGLGSSIAWYTEASGGTSELQGTISNEWVDATAATKKNKFVFGGYSSGVATTPATLTGGGTLTIPRIVANIPTGATGYIIKATLNNADRFYVTSTGSGYFANTTTINSGGLQVPGGSAAAPTIATASNGTTGFFFNNAYIGQSLAGVEKARLGSTGFDVQDTITAGGATNYTSIGPNGVELFGGATMWEDLRIEPTSRGGATEPTFSPTGFDSILYAYRYVDTAATDFLYFNIQMPHGWKEGSGIYPHLHLYPTTTASGDIVFTLACSWAAPGGVFPTSSAYTLTATNAGSNQYAHLMASNATPVDMTGKTLSTIGVCRLTRSTDAYAANVDVLYLDFHYEVNRLGSRQILDNN